jgi:hypothetical protein
MSNTTFSLVTSCVLATSLVTVLLTNKAFGQNLTCPTIYDTVSSRTNESIFQRVQDILSSKEFTSQGDFSQSAVSAGIPVPVLNSVFNVNFGATTANSSWSTWRRDFLNAHYTELASHFEQDNLSQVFGDNALRAFEECLNAPGLHGGFTLNAAKQFRFTLKYGGRKGVVTGAKITPADAVTDCDPRNPFELSTSEQKSGKDLTGEGTSVVCSWNNEPVSIRVVTSEGDKAYLLPPLRLERSPSEKKECVFKLTAGEYHNLSLISNETPYSVPFVCDGLPGNTVVTASFRGEASLMRVSPDRGITQVALDISNGPPCKPGDPGCSQTHRLQSSWTIFRIRNTGKTSPTGHVEATLKLTDCSALDDRPYGGSCVFDQGEITIRVQE